jgi:thiol-disulfide isomerase/thioredoxin
MKCARIAGALLAAAALLLSACSSDGSSSGTYTFHGAQSPPHLISESARKPAQNFSGSLLTGDGTFRLTQDAGKVVVVNFWGAWCPPCRIETPQFNAMYQAYKSKGVAFVGIDIKEASRSLPTAFVRQYKISYPIVYDNEGATAVRLGNPPTQGAPFTILLDSQHRVAGVYLGPLARADLEPMLNTLVAEN